MQASVFPRNKTLVQALKREHWRIDYVLPMSLVKQHMFT